MTALAQSITAALLHFLWQGLLVAFLLSATLFFLKQRSANARYIASCVALALMILLPIATVWSSYTAPNASVLTAGVATGTVVNAVSTGVETSWLSKIQQWALPVWSFGVFLFSVRLLWSYRHLTLLRRSAEPAPQELIELAATIARRAGLFKPARVFLSKMADGPSVVGWFKPIILLPAATLLGLTQEQLESVLAHEIAHIRRRDSLVNLVQILAETVLFYHPAIWWVSSKIRQERELCCDDAAVQACGDAVGYARALTQLERMRPSLALGAAQGPLAYRVRRLIGAASEEHTPSKLPAVLALVLGVACFGLNLNWVHAQEATIMLKKAPGAEDSNGVSVDLGNATVLHRARVEYPKAAIDKQVQGTVSVEATVEADGTVSDARILAGPQELRRAALQSVLRWHFAASAGQSLQRVHIAFDPLAARKEETTKAFSVILRDKSGSEEVSRRERQLEEMKKAAEIISKKIAEGETGEALQEDQRKLEDMKTRAMKAEVELDKARERGAREATTQSTFLFRPKEELDRVTIERKMAPGVLRRIDIRGVDDSLRERLMAHLPVKIGDTIQPVALEIFAKQAKQLDEHLVVRHERMDDGVVLIITANDEHLK